MPITTPIMHHEGSIALDNTASKYTKALSAG